MRLTVRTLLAYLDRVLDEEASKSLKEKLDESEFATQLAEKIASSIKQPDLGAPAVQAVHPIENPNTIAEYLDNVLQPEMTPEIERVLLESDIHMSEAAACHQILTLVLSKPATVSPSLRDRLYELAAQLPKSGESSAAAIAAAPTLDAPSVSALDIPANGAPVETPAEASLDPVAVPFRDTTAASAAGGQATASMDRPQTRKADVPDYLRAGRPSRILPWLMTLGLCAVLLFVIAKAFQPAARVATDNPSNASDMPAPTTDDSPTNIVDDDQSLDDPAESDPAESTSMKEPLDNQGSFTESTDATSEPAVTSTDVVDEPIVPMDDPTNGNSTSEESESVDPTSPSVEPAIETKPAKTDSVEMAEPLAVVPTAEADTEAPTITPDTSTEPTTEPTVEPAEPSVDPAESSTSTTPPTDPDPKPLLAKCDSKDSILLQPAASGWKRVKTGDLIDVSQPILTLPSYRSHVLLSNGVAIAVVGPAEFEISSERNQIRLGYGQFVFKPTAAAGAVAQLSIDDHQATLQFPNDNASAAVQVTSFRPPGSDPTLETSRQRAIAILALSDKVEWSIDGGPSMSLAAPVRWSQIGDAAPVSDIVDEPAAWIATPPANEVSIGAMARNGLLELAVPTKKIELMLRESVGYRRAEVAALGARSLLMLGASDTYFGANGILDNTDQKSHWQDHFVALRQQIDRSPESALRLKESITRMNAAEAESIFRLLSGYSQAQLVAGADFELVEALNDATLHIRVLALENLRQITGTTLSFRPQDSGPRRVSAAKKWDTKLRAGDIRWTEEPKPNSVLDL